MTYNIHRWAGQDQRLDLDRLVEVVLAANADVVCLNEVLHPVLIGPRVREPLAELARRLHMTYLFGPSGWQDHGPGWYGPLGNALLSRYPLSNALNMPLPRLPGTKPRSLLGATLADGPARGLGAFVTHLDHMFEGTRLWQLRGVLRRLAHYGPHFLGGDFNTPGFLGEHSRRLLPPVLRMLHRAGYEDAFQAVGRGHGRTFPSPAPVVRIDFLFMPKYWARGLQQAWTPDWEVAQFASDHRPVLAEWHWPEKPANHRAVGVAREGRGVQVLV